MKAYYKCVTWTSQQIKPFEEVRLLPDDIKEAHSIFHAEAIAKYPVNTVAQTQLFMLAVDSPEVKEYINKNPT